MALLIGSSLSIYLLFFLLSVGPGWYVRGLSADYWNRNFNVGPGVFLNQTTGDVTLIKALGADGSERLKPFTIPILARIGRQMLRIRRLDVIY